MPSLEIPYEYDEYVVHYDNLDFSSFKPMVDLSFVVYLPASYEKQVSFYLYVEHEAKYLS